MSSQPFILLVEHFVLAWIDSEGVTNDPLANFDLQPLVVGRHVDAALKLVTILRQSEEDVKTEFLSQEIIIVTSPLLTVTNHRACLVKRHITPSDTLSSAP